MRYNWFWFMPLVVAVLAFLVVPSFIYGYHGIALFFRRFSWPVLFSPSAAVYFSALLASIGVPLVMTVAIRLFYDPDNAAFQNRYSYTLGMIVGLPLAWLFIQFIAWGAFPLPVDAQGYIHIRMIPFFPWPDTPLFAY